MPLHQTPMIVAGALFNFYTAARVLAIPAVLILAVPRGFEPLSPTCLSNHNVDRISSALKSLACFCVESFVPTVQKRVSTVPNTGNI